MAPRSARSAASATPAATPDVTPDVTPDAAPVTHWRDPAFLQGARQALGRDQMARMEKVFYEPFFLLTRGWSDDRRLTFYVSGSQRDTYLVTFRMDGTFGCTCLDAQLNCARKGCVCKHACFVLVRVLRACERSFTFFGAGRLRLPPEAVTEAFARFREGTLVEEGHMAPRGRTDDEGDSGDTEVSSSDTDESVDEYDRATRQMARLRVSPGAPFDFSHVAKPPLAGDECPVCYDDLLQGPLSGCPECGKGVHTACVRRWLDVAPRRSCVYCRSRDWEHFV